MKPQLRAALAGCVAALIVDAGAASAAAPKPVAGVPPPAAATPAAAAAPARPRPTAKELYIGCYLLIRDTDVPRGPDGHFVNYSAANCGEQVLSTLTYREGNKPQRPFSFCLPDTAALREQPAREMAQAYLDFYERKAARIPPTTDGSAAFIIAMVERWPCPAGAAPKPEHAP